MVEAGVALLLLGAALLVAEAHVPAGVLGVCGSLALAGGAALIAAGAVAGVWLAAATPRALATRKLRAASGREALSGRVGVVRNWTKGNGQVFVDGALWRARRSWADDDAELTAGDSVVVEHVNGLTLAVRRAEDWEEPC
jgi:membrane protein implicated in regulation of membrane protease activity